MVFSGSHSIIGGSLVQWFTRFRGSLHACFTDLVIHLFSWLFTGSVDLGSQFTDSLVWLTVKWFDGYAVWWFNGYGLVVKQFGDSMVLCLSGLVVQWFYV